MSNLPDTWTQVPIVGRYVRANGTPPAGKTIKFVSIQPNIIDDTYILPASLSVQLDSTGAIPDGFTLPATNDPDLAVTDWGWQVTEEFSGGRAMYTIAVPHTSTSVDLATATDIGNIDPTDPTFAAAVIAAQAAQAAAESAEAAAVESEIVSGNNASAAAASADDAAASAALALRGMRSRIVSTDYTFSLSDAATIIEANAAGPCLFTIPLHASVPFPLDTEIGVRWYGVGQPTIDGSLLGTPPEKQASQTYALAAQGSIVILKQTLAFDHWEIYGDLYVAPTPTTQSTTYTSTTSGIVVPTWANSVEAVIIGGGGGGASGRKGAAGGNRNGGGAGAGGAYLKITILASAISGTLTATIGAGGTGGAAVTTSDTDGNAGNPGGISSLADSSGTVFATTVAANGGNPGLATTVSNATGTLGTTGLSGAGAGSIATVPNVPALICLAPGGGGSGGGITGGGAEVAGGVASAPTISGESAIAGGAIATIGNNGHTTVQGLGIGGSGGGASKTTNAGAGGNGGAGGGGGGGSGAALNAVGNSPAGGNGGKGSVALTFRA